MILKYAPLNEGLIYGTKLDGNSNDVLGINNGTDTDMSYVAGVNGNCASFNGTSSKIDLPSSVDIIPFTEKSVSFWFYGIGTGHGFGGLFCTTGSPYGFYAYTSGIYKGVYFSGGSVGAFILFPDNQWSHMTFTFSNDGTIRTYLNGVLTSTSGKHDIATRSLNTIGYFPHYDVYLDTKLEDLYVYDKVLTANEITKLYNNGLGRTYPFN